MKIGEEFVALTERAGDEVTAEQVERLLSRYSWASTYCAGKDVLELACGTGQGVGLIGLTARSVIAGDWAHSLLKTATDHYGERFPFVRLDAQRAPFPSNTFDVVILFEALYYLPDAPQFFQECRRVLRPDGVLLLATANPDLYDFHPSPHSVRYLGVADLERELGEGGFDTTFFGDTRLGAVSRRQRLLRPFKAFASRLDLIPKSADGKKLLKRLVFGRLVTMPAEVTAEMTNRGAPVRIHDGAADREYKVILCAARRRPP